MYEEYTFCYGNYDFFPCLRSEREKPNVVLIVVDALRADHLGYYGYSRNTSPAIDSLALSGMTWDNVQAQSPWTLPSITSIFTGVDVRTHGAGRRGSTVFAMNSQISTLPLFLNQSGYSCSGIFNVYLLSEQFGFNRGFDQFSCEWLGHGKAEQSVDMAIDWIQTADRDEPFFLALHLFDVHDPYDPPAPFDTLFTPAGSGGITWWPFLPNGAPDHPDQYREHLMGLYDGEIRWTDSQISRLLEFLRESELSDNTLIILTSDHGEEFLEHGGFGHGKTLYQEVLHVPLIISGPGIPRGIRDSIPRAQLDILPTVLDIAGVERPGYLKGVSLLEIPEQGRAIPSSNVNSGYVPVVASVTIEGRKIIWNTETNEGIQFNLTDDPLELHPIEADTDMLDSVLFYWSTPCLFPPTIPDKDLIDSSLRDLGYF